MDGNSFHSSSLSLSSSTQSSTAPTSTALYIKQQRRMTVPTSSLNPPEPTHPYKQQPGRPPSPLRNGFVPDTFTGIDVDDESDEEDTHDSSWRSPSPSSSVSQMAATFAQRMGNLVNNITPPSPRGMPTDAELEAEAERERDRSRREAERILTQEAEERRIMEEKVLAMMESTRGSPKSLPPPPSRSQTGSNLSSPANSQKENGTGWWAAAKNKLTPTKEPLTPAQQVILDTKVREKDQKKGKTKEKEWPASTQSKYTDPAFLNLNVPVTPPKRRPVPASPTSPTPLRTNANISTQPLDLSPSPMRPSDATSSSPLREAPPVYAQFNAQGTLDVPGTLLVIAKRFEKLEKWTVGHVRALEERMSDVERWLVDKEREKEDSMSGRGGGKTEGTNQSALSDADVGKEINEIRDDVVELQGRVGELGREMAKLATTPANLSSGPSRQPAPVAIAPQTTSSIAVRSASSLPPDHSSRSPPPTQPSLSAITITSTPRVVSSTARESTSPPMASRQSTAGRTRLPYPTGDYAPPNAESSTPSSPTSSSDPSSSVSGLPPIGLGITSSSQSASTTGLPRSASPIPGLAILKKPTYPSVRPTSVSPTPRKRYTVALGGPITAPDERSEPPQSGTPVSFIKRHSSIETAFFSSPAHVDDDDEDDISTWNDEFQDDTIGKTAAAKITNTPTNNNNANDTSSTSPRPSPSRIRAQSAYGLSSFQNLAHTPTTGSTTPLKPRLRSHSTDRFALGDGAPGSKFVDPLVLRKQTEGERKVAMPVPSKGKVPIGQLVAFFDREKAAKA